MKLRMKTIILVIIFILTTILSTGCTSNTIKEVNVVVPAGAPAISIVKAMKDFTSYEGMTDINYEVMPATDLLVTAVVNGTADIAIVPINLALSLYNKNLDYSLAAVNTWGNLYIVSSEDINSLDDLKGKSLNMTGQGLVPDILFQYIMSQNNIDVNNDLTVNFVAGSTELAPQFLTGKTTISLLPEPILSVVKTKSKVDVNIVVDFQKEFVKATNSDIEGFPQAGILVKNSLLKSDSKLFTEFLSNVKASNTFVNTNPKEAAKLTEEFEMGFPVPVLVKAIPGMNIKYASINDSKEQIESFLKVLYDFNPKAVGGKFPDDEFYIQKKFRD